MTEKNAVESLYLPVCQAIAHRLMIADEALNRVEADPQGKLAQGAFETAVLQTRLLCELFLLGAVAAHLVEGGLNISKNEWRPKLVFQELSKFNDQPLPIPVDLQLNKRGFGSHHVQPKSGALSFQNLSKVYGLCGDFLHIGTVGQVIKGKTAILNFDQLKQWLNDFHMLLMGHILMLPERQLVLLTVWSGDFDESPSVYKLEADGQSTFDAGTLPEFSLLQ